MFLTPARVILLLKARNQICRRKMLAPRPSQHCEPFPHGLMSLWDMLNFKVSLLVSYLDLLDGQIARLRQPLAMERVDPPNALLGIAFPESFDPISPKIVEEVRFVIGGVSHCCAPLNSKTLKQLISEVELTLDYPSISSRSKLADQLAYIRKILEIEFRDEWFYHYPKAKADKLQLVPTEWGRIMDAFPSAKLDVAHGVDSYACDHNTAAVFHMMRVAEVGLVRLAKELKVKLSKDKPLSHAQWGEIVGAIEATAKTVLSTAPAGNGKDEAQAFYNGAASHIRALKDKYRNVVMHSRRSFNEHEAADAMFHTRSFMAGLSEKLSETNSKRINWKF